MALGGWGVMATHHARPATRRSQRRRAAGPRSPCTLPVEGGEEDAARGGEGGTRVSERGRGRMSGIAETPKRMRKTTTQARPDSEWEVGGIPEMRYNRLSPGGAPEPAAPRRRPKTSLLPRHTPPRESIARIPTWIAAPNTVILRVVPRKVRSPLSKLSFSDSSRAAPRGAMPKHRVRCSNGAARSVPTSRARGRPRGVYG